MTIKRLIGSAPSQISRNKDLGNLAFQNKEWARLDNATVDSNLTIGQPTAALQSGGSGITIFGSSYSEIKFLNSSTGNTATDGTALVQNSADFVINNREAGQILFGTSNTTRMTITSAGEVTIANGVTPQYYNEQTLSYPTIRPTLNLDFAGSKSVDSRISFTRASSATYYGDDGKLKYAAQNEPRIDYDPVTGECKGLLIEEQRTNVVPYSSNEYGWVKEQCLYNGTVIAPDGTLTARKFVEDTSVGAYHRVRFSSISVTSGVSYAFSVYAKSTGRQFIVINASALINGRAIFDLTNVTATLSSGTSASITPVGNGWYRCTVVATASLTQTTSAYVGVNTSNTDSSYNGDGLSAFYLWGCQCEAGLFSTSYIPSTDTFGSRSSVATYFDSSGVLRYAGPNQARYSYGYDTISNKWVSQGLLLENSLTNILPYSYDFSAGSWITGAGTKPTVARGYTAPDGSTNATLVTPANTTYSRIGYQFTLPASSNMTFSVFAKAGVKTNLTLFTSQSNYTNFVVDLTNGTISSLSTPGIYVVSGRTTFVGNGWYRIEYSIYNTSASSITETISMSWDGLATSQTTYIWGAQLEAYPVATSYIQTYGSAATRSEDTNSSASTTRSADSAMMYGVDTLFDFNRGATFSYKVTNMAPLTTSANAYVAQIYGGNGFILLRSSGSGGAQVGTAVRDSAGYNVSLNGDSSYYVNGTQKSAIAFNSASVVAGSNGIIIGEDTSVYYETKWPILTLGGTGPTAERINGWISYLKHYPSKLTNAQLQALTV